jgi:hypothetical protein
MKFGDLPIGARFKYPDSDKLWVVVKSYNEGLIASWEGFGGVNRQMMCSFCDAEWTLNSEVEVEIS